MQKIIETIFNVTIILIVALVGTAIGYYSAGYLPKHDAAVETSASAAQAKAEPVRPAAPPAQPPMPMPMQKEPLALAGPLGQPLIPPPPQPETVALADRGQPVLRAEPPARRLTMQARYNSCLQQAEHTFTVAWDASCKTSEAERQKNYQRCLTTPGLSKAACERAHRNVPEKNCKLPAPLSDRLSAQLQSRASQCLQEFRAAGG